MRYVMNRIGQSALVLALVSVIVFVIARLSGNPVDVLVPAGFPAEYRARLIEEMGLDQPVLIQFVHFLKNAITGDFGDSSRFQTPAMGLVLERLPNTIELALAALLVAVFVGIPIGMIAAWNLDGWFDQGVRGLLTLGQATPAFWLAILLILAFGVKLQWLPFIGDQGPTSLIMPAATLAVLPLVTIARITRSATIAVLEQDHVRTARSKGLPQHWILRRHVLRNVLVPVITVGGFMAGELLSGAVITEQIFSWPGVGSLAIQAMQARDNAVIQAVTMVGAVLIITINLLVDLSYMWIDPRIRMGEGADV